MSCDSAVITTRWLASDLTKGENDFVMLEKKTGVKLKRNRTVNRLRSRGASVPASEKTKGGTSTVSVVSV